MKRHTTCLPRLGFGAIALGAMTLSVAPGCDNQIAGEHRLTSLRMLLRAPTESELGSPSNTVTPATLKFDVEAIDEKGQLMAVDASLSAYVVAGGSRLSLVDPCQTATPTGDPTVLKSIGMRRSKTKNTRNKSSIRRDLYSL